MAMLRKQQVVCLFLLLLMLFPSETPSFADGHGRFKKLRTGSSSTKLNHVRRHDFFRRNAGKNEEIFDDQKRKIHTGPNPLHNR
ncbi:hypothetical protein Nepgr_031257 [Nepenthes gracilis]|uniref:Uncharacterized protein n=1 Tax=Nepenthes gracilis TaxID=150966 RepID=A0AAD3Y6W1_NEPGR|nr:hypothetical protein Nepgr_031257 [Nepenthes gracilis]